jgi:hypothetical protein
LSYGLVAGRNWREAEWHGHLLESPTIFLHHLAVLCGVSEMHPMPKQNCCSYSPTKLVLQFTKSGKVFVLYLYNLSMPSLYRNNICKNGEWFQKGFSDICEVIHQACGALPADKHNVLYILIGKILKNMLEEWAVTELPKDMNLEEEYA